ncbi:MAG TPA: acetoacetate decarboxylase family protein [Vicinamibacterales bacterium]|nr:acetoacetate decarboxylase family protein [Vicinamibacterales bacterium]
MRVTWTLLVWTMLAAAAPAFAQATENYVFIPGEWYRMPTHFGPATGPRKGPDRKAFDWTNSPKSTVLSVSFLGKRDQMQKLLPPGFTINGEPLVTVSMTYFTEIAWLAGRGYNTLGVSFPVTFTGKQDKATGTFLLILWENLTDPIITGREELGFSKLYAELPPARMFADTARMTASWLEFPFMEMELTGLTQVQLPVSPASPASPALRGQMHYKYMPRTGEWGKADASYAVITPAGGSTQRTLEMWRGKGSVKFHRARWEDMPTQYMIVNAFADLEIVEFRGATLTKSVGGKDLSDQRIIK